MTKRAPEILQLRLDIEQNISRRILTPYDFEFLSGAIWERLHENISPTTLKRLWGYIDGADTSRRSTLNLLARFLGYADWDAYIETLISRSDTESQTFCVDSIHASDLVIDQLIEVTWLPNRRCVFRYLGENRFVVVESANAKLHVDDKFVCTAFFKDQPMYIDELVQGTSAPVSYVAGTKRGIHFQLLD